MNIKLDMTIALGTVIHLLVLVLVLVVITRKAFARFDRIEKKQDIIIDRC